MLRTIIVRNDLIKGTLRKAIRTNLTRSFCFESSKRWHKCNQPSLLIPTQNAPWRYNVLRFYASLPEHIKVLLPALSPTMESGTIISWSKKEGDQLVEGDLLCEIETDKATMGFETPEVGYLAKILVPAGTKNVKIGVLVCIIVENKEDIAAFKDFKGDASAPAAAPSAPAPSAPAPSAPTPKPSPPPAARPPTPAPAAAPSGARVYASPLAKKLARDGNLSLQGKGTGVYDSITSKDLAGMAAGAAGAPAAVGGRQSAMAQGLAEAHAKRGKGAAPGPAPSAPKPSALKPGSPSTFVDIPVTNIRSVIAKRLLESKLTIPHYYLTNHCNADKMIKMRKKINKRFEKEGIRISINDFIMKATACASAKVPDMNAAWLGDKIRQFDNVDISLAVSTPTGLITPIIFNANGKGILQISAETKELAAKARANKLQPHEFQGGTITVSNLGMFGISQFNAIVNPPQCAILAVGSNETRLVIDEDSDRGFRAAQYISFSLSADHRVVDGALGAEWFKAFRGYIEDPETMIL